MVPNFWWDLYFMFINILLYNKLFLAENTKFEMWFL
jgi:hypothetical protein